VDLYISYGRRIAMKNRLETYYNTAVWKLDTPFENWLSYKADKFEFFKKLYVLYYKVFDKEYYKNGLPMLDHAISDYKDSNCGKELPVSDEWLRRDMIYTLHRFGADFQEYFVFEFFKRNTVGREEFITNKKRYGYYHLLNADENFTLFEDKKKTYQLFGKYYKRDVLTIDSAEDKDKFVEFAADHKEFIFKPAGGAEGRGIQKLSFATSQEAVVFFDSQIGKGSYVVEEVIVQDKIMANLHRESVNTVRVPSIICRGEVKIFYPFLRMGMGNSVVDNIAAGGIAASVDAETGIVYTKGLTKKGRWYLKHPDTGTQIVGFQIPDWDKLVDLAKEITPMVEGTRYIGWDFAFTSKGWIVVEGNALGTVGSMQGQDKVGRKEELLELIALGR
jgi:glutathione synthase/RimK-type ligase-like ATP-grasp enzyme